MQHFSCKVWPHIAIATSLHVKRKNRENISRSTSLSARSNILQMMEHLPSNLRDSGGRAVSTLLERGGRQWRTYIEITKEWASPEGEAPGRGGGGTLVTGAAK